MSSDGFEEIDHDEDVPDDEADYELAFPIVAVQSSGGEYDDNAFIAGMYCGMIHTFLQTTNHDVYEAYVPIKTLAQLDLIAMSHGWVTRSSPWEGAPDEWALIVFTRPVGNVLSATGIEDPWNDEPQPYDQDGEDGH